MKANRFSFSAPALAFALVAFAALVTPVSTSPRGVTFDVSTAQAGGTGVCANGGIDVTSKTAATDQLSWQTGLGQDCTLPFDQPKPAGHCMVIDSIHLELSKRLADTLNIHVGDDRVTQGEHLDVRMKGPVFLVIDEAFSNGEVYIYEGQVVVPKPAFFRQRVKDRFKVDMAQASRTEIIQPDGSFAPATEDRYVTIFGAKVNVGLCEDPA